MKQKLHKINFFRFKKVILSAFLLLSTVLSAQETQFYTALANNGSTSGNSRAPQGAMRYSRTVWLITPAEMATSGLVNGDVLSAIGFNYSTAQSPATTGNFTVYLENTTDVANNKSTAWATAITGMTTASNSTITIPATTGYASHSFAGGSPFTYTGGGLYVAFDYQNAAGAIATTANVALCTTSLANGLKSGQSTTVVPTTIAASNWRPETLLGKQVTCAEPFGVNFSGQTDTSAIINWTGSINAELEWGLYPYTQGGGGSTATVTGGNTYTIAGLTPGKAYTVYVRKNCGGGVYSTWKSIVIGTNNTSPITAFPYTMNFEPTADQFYLFNLGWGNQPTGNVGSWSWFSDVNYAQTPTYFLGSIISSTTAQNAWIFSAPIAMQLGYEYSITYNYRTFSTAATTAPMNFRVGVNTTNSGTGATILTTKTGISTASYLSETLTYVPTTSGNYYVGFHNNTPAAAGITTNNYIFIDTFGVSSTLGMGENSVEKTISVYPNPASNFIKVSNSELAGISKITITDINSRVIKSTNFDAVSEAQINIAELTSGVYFLNIDTTNGSITKKFVKN